MRKSIVLAADNVYLIPLETTIKSVLYHNRDVDFYILNSDIAPEWFKLLGRKMEVVNSTIRSVHIDKELFESYKTGPHINYASYFRFFATEVVESDRVLYLDSDIIVTGELATLFEIDLKGYSIGAVDDVYAYEGRKSGFNSGVLLMDVAKWKEHSIVNSLLELAAEQNQVVHLGDQSILNIYFEDNWLALDKTYNYMVGVDIYHLAQECERLDDNPPTYVTGKDFCVEELAIQEIMNRQAGDWKFNSSAFILPTFKLIKKELFNEVHFSNGRRFDDEATMHRFYLLASKIVFINDNLYLYRRRSGSIMRTEFDLSWARDIVEVFSKKISDCVLAGLDVSVLRIRFVNLLKDYKQTLEYHQLTDTEEYKDICFRLKLFFDAEQRNGKS
ncbi:TPA: glycosyltransferase family 8 protein [Streptococcus pneumoniae]